MTTGVMAAGKSTALQALAERPPKSVHRRGDVFRKIISGRAAMTAELPEAQAQLDLRYRLAAGAARAYLDAGFSVVYQDVIVGTGLTAVLGLLPVPPVRVVLYPNAEVVAARDAARPKTGCSEGSTAARFDLRNETPRWGLWLDTSA